MELLWAGAASLPDAPGGTEDAPSELLGYSTGWTQPTGVCHLESIKVREFSGYWTRKAKRSRLGRRYARAPTEHGLGLLLSTGVACWVTERAPFFRNRRAQLLAILDEPRQHKTLLRYYRYLGFAPLREVGDGLGSAGDLVVWGGVGTLMECDLIEFRRRWGAAVRRLGRASI